MEVVTVALPVWNDPGTLKRAVDAIRAQTWHDLDILLILNGSNAPTIDLAEALAHEDRRIRILRLPAPNLAAALNLALKEARGDLLARMDADDTCPPQRLALQIALIKERPDLAAVGCAFDVVDARGHHIATIRPPTDPAESRWKLLLGNRFAHGSMVLRRKDILAVGGYDDSLARAQDYDLWLRLSQSRGIAAHPDVLYTYRARDPRDLANPADTQIDTQTTTAVQSMLAAWSKLPPVQGRDALAAAMVRGMSQGSAAAQEVEQILAREGPSREALMAWLLSRPAAPAWHHRAAEASRRARLREVAAQLRAQGITTLWLWGAGDHTRRLLEHPEDLGLPIRGIVDDAASGERFGFPIARPSSLKPSEAVLLSSDWHEDAMWESSSPHRDRGVKVFKLYG